MSSLFDPGLQPERTELAWRRTALAIGVGSLVALRLLPVTLERAWWTLFAASGLVVAAVIWHSARLRYLAVSRALASGNDDARLPGGLALAGVTVLVAVAGVAGVVVVVARAVAR